MSRPRKQTVDYFPHYCNHGKTIFILEERFGNNGYAFWFKLLEMLGNSNGHFIDCNDSSSWQFLMSITHTTEISAIEILELLSKLNAIDTELWNNKIIWCQNFVDGIKDAYTKRTVEVPQKPVSGVINTTTTTFPTPEIPIIEVSDTQNPQIKVNKSKVNNTKLNKTKRKKTKIYSDFSILISNRIVKIIQDKKLSAKVVRDNFNEIELLENKDGVSKELISDMVNYFKDRDETNKYKMVIQSVATFREKFNGLVNEREKSFNGINPENKPYAFDAKNKTMYIFRQRDIPEDVMAGLKRTCAVNGNFLVYTERIIENEF